MPDILHAIQIVAAAKDVYPLTAGGGGFAQWWAEDVTEVEGAVEPGFFGRTTIYRLRLIDGIPGHRAEWRCETGNEWAGTRMLFEVSEAGSGKLLRFSHAGWESETPYFRSCNTTWGGLMFRLKAAAEGKNRGPLFLAEGMAY